MLIYKTFQDLNEENRQKFERFVKSLQDAELLKLMFRFSKIQRELRNGRQLLCGEFSADFTRDIIITGSEIFGDLIINFDFQLTGTTKSGEKIVGHADFSLDDDYVTIY